MASPEVRRLTASNGEATCSVQNVRLHSAYNPSKEAERFVQSIPCSFTPAYVVVTEPVLSYCATPLRERFRQAVLCCIRYSDEFRGTDSLWDKVLTLDGSPLADQLYTFMGDEGLGACLFAAWQPSETVFSEQAATAWAEIKAAVLKSRNVLATRSYFAARWTKNCLRFCQFVRFPLTVRRGSMPVVACASGPSLATSIPFLRTYRERFFLLAVSSALSPLLRSGIVPDLCLSTDGGYWAKQHLSFALQEHPRLPLALPLEAACRADVLATHPVLPLSYGDGAGESLLKECAYPSFPALRNGTVSGTAAQLALSLTTGDVFFCGLDLAPSSGFAHMQPNELELANAVRDTRLAPKETRLATSGFFSAALDIYRGWFAGASFGGRLFRLSDRWAYRNTLGEVPDTDWEFFAARLDGRAQRAPELLPVTAHFLPGTRRNALHEAVLRHAGDPVWIKEALPARSLAYERSRGTPEEAEAARAIQAEMRSLSAELLHAIGIFTP